MLEDDLAVFFDAADFACTCTPSRNGTPAAAFRGILGAVDASLYDGNITAGTTALRFAAAAAQLQPGDQVVTQATNAAGNNLTPKTWRVLRTPEKQVDGAECECWLVPAGGS